MTAPEGLTERPTLRSTVDLLGVEAGANDGDLADLVSMACSSHEPGTTANEPLMCPSCYSQHPCPVWRYARAEAGTWIVDRAMALAGRIHDRLDRIEGKS